MEHLISPIKFYAKQISSRTCVVTPCSSGFLRFIDFHLVFISGLWCNTVQNQLCYSYIVEKLRCCLLPLPTKSVLPLFLKCNRHYKYCILLNFVWQYKLFVFKWSSVQAFSICIFLTVWIYCHIPKLLNYIELTYSQTISSLPIGIWCFLPKRWEQCQKSICSQLK